MNKIIIYTINHVIISLNFAIAFTLLYSIPALVISIFGPPVEINIFLIAFIAFGIFSIGIGFYLKDIFRHEKILSFKIIWRILPGFILYFTKGIINLFDEFITGKKEHLKNFRKFFDWCDRKIINPKHLKNPT